MSRNPNHPDLENPPYCKVAIEYGERSKRKTEIVKGFHSIKYLYPDEYPNRLSVIYMEEQEPIPENAEWIGDQPEGAEKSYELIFNNAQIKEVTFEDRWD